MRVRRAWGPNETRDEGQSLVEAVVLGLSLFVPLILAVVLATSLHRANLAADSAAREAARAWSTAGDPSLARARAEAAARRAVADYGFAPDSVSVSITGSLAPGGLVTVATTLPVPQSAGLLRATRRAVADVDRLRASAEAR